MGWPGACCRDLAPEPGRRSHGVASAYATSWGHLSEVNSQLPCNMLACNIALCKNASPRGETRSRSNGARKSAIHPMKWASVPFGRKPNKWSRLRWIRSVLNRGLVVREDRRDTMSSTSSTNSRAASRSSRTGKAIAGSSPRGRAAREGDRRTLDATIACIVVPSAARSPLFRSSPGQSGRRVAREFVDHVLDIVSRRSFRTTRPQSRALCRATRRSARG